MLLATMNLNQAKSGIELTFNEKPSDIVRESLKELGFRWSNKLGFWWARQTDARLALAKSLCTEAPKAEPKAKAEPKVQELKVSDLSEKCKFTVQIEDGTFKAVKGYVFTAGLGKCKKLHLGVAKEKDGTWSISELSTGALLAGGYEKRYLALEAVNADFVTKVTKLLKTEKAKKAAANLAAFNA